MNQTDALQHLADRLVRLEAELGGIRQELVALREQTPVTAQDLQPSARIPFSWADKAALQRAMNEFVASLGIQGEAQGSEALQQLMSEAGLAPNELSQGIIDMREE